MSSVVLWLSSFTGVHFLPVVSVSTSSSCSGSTAGMYFPFLALFLPVANESTVTNSQVGWASLRLWQFSSRFSLWYCVKSFCSPLNGDFEICEEGGDVLRTEEPSAVSCFTGERNSFAFPLAGVWTQPQSQRMRRCYCTKNKNRIIHLHRRYAAGLSSSPARGDFFLGEDDKTEVGSISGSNKGATL